jgi:HK97 family phage portal protein
MSFIKSITQGFQTLRADSTGTPAPWDDYWYSNLGFSSASGVRVNADSAKRIAAVLACVGVIGRNIGMMPCKIYTEAPDGSKRVVTHHPLYEVLYSRPNSQQTAFEFKQMMQGHVELRGNAYAEIKPGPRGAVDQLIPMHPDRVRVERLQSGKLRYQYDDPLTNNTRALMEEEVFHLRNYSDDGMVGQSTVAMAVDLFGVALAQQDFVARFMKNDARPPIVFETAGPVFKTKTQEEEFLKSWQDRHTAANRGKAGLLPFGITAKVLGVTPVDQELLDAMKFGRIQICSIFGVPPHLIGETEKAATYASVEQFNIMYSVHCILPRIVMWEQAIQRDLITSDRFFAKFSMAALLRGDTASRFAAYQVAIQNGWMNQDEVRLLEDLNPIPNGDGKTYWRQSAWIPLGQIEAVTPDAQANQIDTSDPNDDGSAGDGTQGKIRDARLKALANSAAERCVRKEVSALRKLVDRGATGYDFEQFYEEHLGFVSNVLGIEAADLVDVRQEHYNRAECLSLMISQGDFVEAKEFIDKIAVMESLRLAAIAVKGVAA